MSLVMVSTMVLCFALTISMAVSVATDRSWRTACTWVIAVVAPRVSW